MSSQPDINQLQEKKIDLINRARTVLKGEQWSDKKLQDLCDDLVELDQFAYATDIMFRKMEFDYHSGHPVSPKEHQNLAKYIYKDHSLPSSFKFNRALSELTTEKPLVESQVCEILGLAGAIYKRKWQFDHMFKNLILSRFYYRRGFDIWKKFIEANGNLAESVESNDQGFTAINYTYINELMAVDKLEEHGKVTGVTENINKKLKETEAERKYILKALLKEYPSTTAPELKTAVNNKWTIATAAEAFFGLRDYANAEKLIRDCIASYRNKIKKDYADKETDVQEQMLSWEIRTFQMQLYSIAYLQLYQKKFVEGLKKYEDGNTPEVEKKLRVIAADIRLSEMDQCLSAFTITDNNTENKTKPEIKKEGKTGLALSGGGFRASIFHIGVLAALAEKDELKNIQVISCVSGGSIIGAYYYLKLKTLLEAKPDAEISKADYVSLVKEIEADFLPSVQKNLRARIFSDLRCNFRMISDQNYSRTHRLGELYEEHLYQKLLNKGPIYMNDLYIYPKDKPTGFEISTDNWSRRNKVPQLVLNATSVNTGHNWQFTASWMGEPPGNIQTDIDVKPRLRRMYYKEAPEKYKKFRLGYAVGASSCVPVMFRPMPVFGLYEGIDLQLIDGGLHDNQGIAALIEQECKNMIISDASGQLPTSKVAAQNAAAVFYRADSILQERLRELQFMDIKERNNTTQLNRLISIHLKSGLQKYPVKWVGCDDPARKILYSNVPDELIVLTNYGVLRESQTLLSEIRTDLDSFNDVESYALMFSAYKQVLYAYSNQEINTDDPETNDWKFLAIEKYVTTEEYAPQIEKVLTTAKNLPFKAFAFSKLLRWIILGLKILAVLAVLYFAYQYICVVKANWGTSIYSLNITVGAVLLIVAVFVTGFFSKQLARLINIRSFTKQKVFLAMLMVLFWIASRFHLAVLNKIYNNAGKLESIKATEE